MYLRKMIISLAMTLPLTGCVHSATTATPISGAVNSFDSTTYQALATAHAFVTTAASNPSVLTATEKTVLNQLIQDLNAADLLYTAYHTAAAAGTASPTATQATVSAAVSKVTADQASYAAVSGVK